MFDSKPDSVTNRDTIVDFSHEQGDQIALSLKWMAGLAQTVALPDDEFYAAPGATRAHDSSDRIIYNTLTGVLYYDADGIGGHAANAIAALKGTPALGLSDFHIIA